MTKKKPADAPTEVHLERMPLSTLLGMRHERNPKEHDIPSLVDSFRRFGFVAFPTIDEASGVLVAGHGRCEALETIRVAGERPPMNVTEDISSATGKVDWLVPVVRGVAFVSEIERDAFVVADNQHVMNGGWQFDKLTDMLGRLGADGGSYQGLGFEQVELDNLLGNYRQDPAPPDGYDPEGAPSDKPRTTITAHVTCPSCGHTFER
jgi:hypothetical protein